MSVKGISINEELVVYIKELAQSENRNLSNMICTLIRQELEKELIQDNEEM
jgi:hypothetical protein